MRRAFATALRSTTWCTSAITATIGEDVVIAAQTGLSGSIVIEKGVILGGQVGIGEHARIEEGVMLGGQGGVLPNKILRGKGWRSGERPRSRCANI